MMVVRKKVSALVVHCSATKPNMDVGAAEIRLWHIEKGWEDIGYHYVIRKNGTIEVGRPERFEGAHVQNHNHDTIGVCLVGGLDKDGLPDDTFSKIQKQALRRLLIDLQQRYPKSEVLGHHDFPGVTKSCPCFNVKDWWLAG